MKKALIISLLALWAWLAPVSCIAAIDSSLLDNSTVQPRLPQKETIEEYKSDSDLNYAETKVSDRSWWEDFWRWFRSLFKIDLPQSSNVLEDPFFWVFVALLVAAIVYFIFKNEIINIFGRSSGSGSAQSLRTEFLDLSTDTQTLESQLQKAIEAKNYREAIRLYYTLTLKILTDSKNIDFRIDKTNNEYLYEMPDGALRQPFKNLTFYFDYIFYGKFEATESIFLKMKDNYGQLTQNIKKAPTR